MAFRRRGGRRGYRFRRRRFRGRKRGLAMRAGFRM